MTPGRPGIGPSRSRPVTKWVSVVIEYDGFLIIAVTWASVAPISRIFFSLSAMRSAGLVSQIRLFVSDTLDSTIAYGLTTVLARLTTSRAEKVTQATSVSFLERMGFVVYGSAPTCLARRRRSS